MKTEMEVAVEVAGSLERMEERDDRERGRGRGRGSSDAAG